MRSRFARWYAANRRALRSESARVLVQAAKYGCIGTVVGTHVVSFISCEGPSMVPTFAPSGDWLVAERLTAPKAPFARPLAALGLKLRVGDVVWCRSPRDPTSTVVKRIVAMGGDEVPVVVNDIFGERVVMKSVPLGTVWLHGDNLADSTDSRDYGAVPLALINGKVLFRIRPWQSLSYVANSLAFLHTGGHALHAKETADAAAAEAAAAAVAALASTAAAGSAAAPSQAPAARKVVAEVEQWATAAVASTAAVATATLGTGHHHTRVALAQKTDAKATAAPAATAATTTAAAVVVGTSSSSAAATAADAVTAPAALTSSKAAAKAKPAGATAPAPVR